VSHIVAATGVCVNESEVLPDSLKEKLALGNFLAPRSEWPSIASNSGATKTWRYTAENVNDFVFTASADFCLDTGRVGEAEVVIYALRKNARKWSEAVTIGRQAIETFSELYYPYQWPVLRICDAYSGMEYPMLTNCSYRGFDNGFRLLLYHEIGHQWFMGHVGTNAVDRPFLDEGFTTHAEHNAMEKYLGRRGNMDRFTNWYQRRFAPHVEDRYIRGFYPLLMLMKQGYDQPMVFSFDQAEEYWPFRVSAYYKGAALHYSLRSILGDSSYYAAMQHYCDRWLFKHPYEDEFTAAMEEATDLELSEYLNQWYYRRDRLDYAFAGMSRKQEGYNLIHTIRLKRPGRFVSPVDIAIIYPHGDTAFFTVAPEGMGYAKPGYALLPVWEQFRRLSDEYEFTVRSRRPIEKVVIDPHQLLMDINRLNNGSGTLPPVEVRLDNLLYDQTPLDRYALRWRPDLWYDEPNGLQVGLHSHGSYLEEDYRYSLDMRVGTESWRPTIDLDFSQPSQLLGRNSKVGYRFLRADRRTYFSNYYQKRFQRLYEDEAFNFVRLELDAVNVAGDQPHRLDPLPEPATRYLPDNYWDAAATFYARVLFADQVPFRYGRLRFVTTQIIGGYDENDRLRGFLQSEYRFDFNLRRGRRPLLDIRLEIQTLSGEPPTQFLYHLSRVPAVERFVASPLFRSPGTFPVAWEDDFYLAGGRVRGYQDRVAFFADYRGGSVSLRLPDLLPYRWLRRLPLVGRFLSRADQALFVDAAYITMFGKEHYYRLPVAANETATSGNRWTAFVSAGVSVSFPPVWRGQRLRLDFPVYLNRPASGENEVAFRFSVAWILPERFER
jgi:hypothetical protein